VSLYGHFLFRDGNGGKEGMSSRLFYRKPFVPPRIVGLPCRLSFRFFLPTRARGQDFRFPATLRRKKTTTSFVLRRNLFPRPKTDNRFRDFLRWSPRPLFKVSRSNPGPGARDCPQFFPAKPVDNLPARIFLLLYDQGKLQTISNFLRGKRLRPRPAARRPPSQKKTQGGRLPRLGDGSGNEAACFLPRAIRRFSFLTIPHLSLQDAHLRPPSPGRSLSSIPPAPTDRVGIYTHHLRAGHYGIHRR